MRNDELPAGLLAFFEGIVAQESFVREGYEYNVNTFTSQVKAEEFMAKNDTFHIMKENAGYIYVGEKILIESENEIEE